MSKQAQISKYKILLIVGLIIVGFILYNSSNLFVVSDPCSLPNGLLASNYVDESHKGISYSDAISVNNYVQGNGNRRWAFIKFQISQNVIDAVINGKSIDSAKIDLYVNNVNAKAVEMELYTASSNWDKQTLKWNNMPSAIELLAPRKVYTMDAKRWIAIPLSTTAIENIIKSGGVEGDKLTVLIKGLPSPSGSVIQFSSMKQGTVYNCNQGVVGNTAPQLIINLRQPVCVPKWQCSGWKTDSKNKVKTRTCTDDNLCGIKTDKPAVSVPYITRCIPNWKAGSWSKCVNGIQTRTMTDTNKCGILGGKPPTAKMCTNEKTLSSNEIKKILASIKTENNTQMISSLQEKQRPLIGGLEIDMFIDATTIGRCTLGAIVQYQGKNYILTAGHCVAKSSTEIPSSSDLGTSILQGWQKVGSVYKIADYSGEIDAALISINDGIDSKPEDAIGNKISGFDLYANGTVFNRRVGLPVYKIGRTTGLTYGVILEDSVGTIDNVTKSWLRDRKADYLLEFSVTNTKADFCAPGDSGSAVVTVDLPHRIIGILASETADGICYADTINNIKNNLDISPGSSFSGNAGGGIGGGGGGGR